MTITIKASRILTVDYMYIPNPASTGVRSNVVMATPASRTVKVGKRRLGPRLAGHVTMRDRGTFANR